MAQSTLADQTPRRPYLSGIPDSLQPKKTANQGRLILSTPIAIPCLAECEGNVTVLDHVLDLSPHCLTVSECIKRSAQLNLLVKEKSMSQYTTKTGQKTGKLKISNQLHTKLMTTARVAECQNLNSGKRLMNGLNSSSCFVGNELRSPSSSPSS